jgi:hypothetical protein
MCRAGVGPGAWPVDARLLPLRAASLPGAPAERFAALFAVRERWDMREMEPFLEGMQVVSSRAGAAELS